MNHEEELCGSIFEPGTVIFHQGEPGDTLYLIQSGAVEYSYRQGDTETVLTILESGGHHRPAPDWLGNGEVTAHERYYPKAGPR